MSRKIPTLAIALLVALSGCQILSGSDTATPTETATPPPHHELVVGSHVDEFDATVTVSKDGETVFERTVSSGPNGTYHELPVLEEPGPYTVTINTTHQVVDENLSEQFRIDGDTGNATLIRIGYSGIYPSTIRLPRDRLDHPLATYSNYMSMSGSETVDLKVTVWFRGEQIAETTKNVEPDKLTRVVELDRVGVYHVAARADGKGTDKTLVVTDPRTTIQVMINVRGEVREIRVLQPRRWQ